MARTGRASTGHLLCVGGMAWGTFDKGHGTQATSLYTQAFSDLFINTAHGPARCTHVNTGAHMYT